MSEISVIRTDLAKRRLQLHGANAASTLIRFEQLRALIKGTYPHLEDYRAGTDKQACKTDKKEERPLSVLFPDFLVFWGFAGGGAFRSSALGFRKSPVPKLL